MKLVWTGPSKTLRTISEEEWVEAGLTSGEPPLHLDASRIGASTKELTVDVSDAAAEILLRTEPANWRQVEEEEPGEAAPEAAEEVVELPDEEA